MGIDSRSNLSIFRDILDFEILVKNVKEHGEPNANVSKFMGVGNKNENHTSDSIPIRIFVFSNTFQKTFCVGL